MIVVGIVYPKMPQVSTGFWKKKKGYAPFGAYPFHIMFDSVQNDLAVLAHLSEAGAAVNGTIALGLEGHLGLAAALSADSGEVLTGTAGSVLASVAAGLAALGLVLETALCVELLLTGGEHELFATLFAH
jgi:hypothetical protein